VARTGSSIGASAMAREKELVASTFTSGGGACRRCGEEERAAVVRRPRAEVTVARDGELRGGAAMAAVPQCYWWERQGERRREWGGGRAWLGLRHCAGVRGPPTCHWASTPAVYGHVTGRS
jgi:hypothetical protein